MAEEALKSITSLLDSVPGWIADMEKLLMDVSENKKESNTDRNTQELQSQPKPASKSSSMARQTKDSKVELNGDAKKQLSPTAPALQHHLTDTDAVKRQQQERKASSVVSGTRSGPAKCQSKTMTLVYYNADVQKHFESIVRAIGANRNYIRRARKSVECDTLTRADSNSSDSSRDSGNIDRMNLQHFGGLSPKPLQFRRAARSPFGSNERVRIFDVIDGHLDKSQAMCERAAHQILRDGDCSAELTTAKLNLVDAERVAQTELPALKKRAEKAAERQRKEDELQRSQQITSEPAVAKKLPDLVSFLPTDIKLEVDDTAADDDDDEGEFVMPVMPTGRMNMQSARVAAH